ncbi:10996_t:CDS:2 [Cetraspora pellucida]|uniref:10996_t:CDS:1 n=1 Tax=Cetraspora pellucida TaxID=1433469 RepID=A0ACA9M572_9GLOM|nr:10996_t:CDS:2 [Cetraspora pellucida]
MITRLLKKVIIFDAFSKVDSGYQHKSPQGGFVTIIISILLSFLIISEFREYWGSNQKYEFLVDRSINHKMQINVDITVNTPYLTVDLLDAAGESIHFTDELKVFPAIFEVREAHHLGYQLENEVALDLKKMMFDAAAKVVDTFNPNSDAIDNQKSACRVFGALEVNKVTGNLHITAVGHGYSGNGRPVAENNFLLNAIELIIVFLIHKDVEAFQYFLSVVPTTYIDSFNRVLLTNQYAVTDYTRIIDETKQPGVPGIFFKYDMEPISVRITEKSTTFTKFLTRLCGLVGGVWVTAGFVLRFATWIWMLLDRNIGNGINPTRRSNSVDSNVNGAIYNGGVRYNYIDSGMHRGVNIGLQKVSND